VVTDNLGDALVVIGINTETCYLGMLWGIPSLAMEVRGMPRSSPFDIHLSGEERKVLEARTRKYTLPYCEVLRARMILMAAEGMRNVETCGEDRHSGNRP
jgi:hypothetical protein